MSEDILKDLEDTIDEGRTLARHHVEFFHLMYNRWYHHLMLGYRGWNDPKQRDELRSRLMQNVDSYDWLDVAVYAMFLFFMDKEK